MTRTAPPPPPPPSYIYRRNQMRRFAYEVIACSLLMFALVWFTVTPDDMTKQAQMEDSQ